MAKKKANKESEPNAPLWARLVVGITLFCVLLGLMGVALVGADYARWQSQPAYAFDEPRTVVVPTGTNWSEVVRILSDAGVVERPRYFDFWARRAELPTRVKAGTFIFEGSATLDALAAQLAEGGRVDEVEVTIPEGFNIWGIAGRLEKAGLVSAADFLDAATDPDALAAAEIDADSFEGYLFPDTYRFSAGTSAAELVDRLHRRWRDVWDALEVPGEVHGLRNDELVTLASIVEKETGLAAERPLIARVFLNRLDRGMPLQSDPTCVYSAQRWTATPTRQDCRDPLNRYSTYVVKRLPPGPIANPGRAALKAVIEPDATEEGADYLYFVAKRDGTGAHQFSTTLSEHNRAVRKYLK